MVEFRGDFWPQKTRVPWLLRGVACLILRLAVLVEQGLGTDTDRQTDRHKHRRTQGHSIYRASIASRGKNVSVKRIKWQSRASTLSLQHSLSPWFSCRCIQSLTVCLIRDAFVY